MPARNWDEVKHRVEDFLKAFFETGEIGDAESHVRLYADRAMYFDEGRFSRDKILADTVAYNARWPVRSYDVDDPLEIVPQGENYLVRFPMSYDLKSPGRKARGKLMMSMTLADKGRGFQILSIREDRGR